MPRIRFLLQPDVQIGREILRLLEEETPRVPLPVRIVLVSAWANRQTLLRLRPTIRAFRDRGIPVRIVLGVDLGGTSKEALLELRSWNVDAWLLKNRRGGSTFHPKVFVVERPQRADVLVGSSNLTDGGLFTNYEAVVHLEYDLRRERPTFDEFLTAYRRFLDPSGTTALPLGRDLLETLLARGDIPTEEQIRKAQREASRGRRGDRAATAPESPFGAEVITPPPALPAEVLGELLERVRRERRPAALTRRRPQPTEGRARQRGAVSPEPPARIVPTAFYMTLPKMRGGTIPGEARIPLDARDLAEDFWAWRDHYVLTTSPRGGSARQ
jgi:hypothetical protein